MRTSGNKRRTRIKVQLDDGTVVHVTVSRLSAAVRRQGEPAALGARGGQRKKPGLNDLPRADPAKLPDPVWYVVRKGETYASCLHDNGVIEWVEREVATEWSKHKDAERVAERAGPGAAAERAPPRRARSCAPGCACIICQALREIAAEDEEASRHAS